MALQSTGARPRGARGTGSRRRLLADVALGGEGVRPNLTPVEFGQVPWESAVAFREVKPYKDMKHKPNRFWVSSTRQQILVESRTEARRALELDFEGTSKVVLGQPFELRLTGVGDKRVSHVPDFVVVFADGSVRVEDVKPDEFSQKEDFVTRSGLAREFCQQAGVDYLVTPAAETVRFKNIDFLSAYRRFIPSDEGIVERLVRLVASGPLAFRTVKREARLDVFTLPTLFWLMWRRAVAFDLSAPLTPETVVWLGAGDVR